ncbi:MAG: glycosyltransferase [Chlamydiae bacterium]|nr:glycosyltransferase [Chlamydiota bacterium]
MKTALVHDWLTGVGGGERVLESIYDLYPSKIHVLIKNPEKLDGTFFEDKEIETSFIQALPFAKKHYRNYLPFFPLAIEQFDLCGYDLIISTSHAVAKGVLTNSNQLHICYCFTPMRYAWDLYQFHMSHLSGLKRPLASYILHAMRKWDCLSAPRVDEFVTISHYVAKRIKKIYGREAPVIYPPVDTKAFFISNKKEEYYITYSRLVPYKKIDLIVAAFAKMPEKRLIVIGDGPEMSRIKSVASQNVELLGYQPDSVVRSLLGSAKAFIFAAEEDFGIVMVEALASGIPVIAFDKGASREIVKDGVSGIFFQEQTIASLCEAVCAYERCQNQFDPYKIKESAERFSQDRFKDEFRLFVDEKFSEFTQQKIVY